MIGSSMETAVKAGQGLRSAALYTGFALWTVGAQAKRVAGIINKAWMGAAKTYAEFEWGQKRVAIISGASAAQTKLLAEETIALGRATEWTTTQITEAEKILAMAGFTINEILTATPEILSLATIGLIDTKEAAKIAAEALKGFGYEAESLTTIVSAMAYAITHSLSTIQSLGTAFPYVSATARQFGYDIQTVTAAIMLMSNAGIEGSKSGMAMRSILMRVAKAVGIVNDEATSAAAVIKKYGFSFVDAEGNLKPFPDLIDEINEKLEGVSQTERVLVAQSIAGLRYGTALLALLDEGGDALRKQAENMEAVAVRQFILNKGYTDATRVLEFWRKQMVGNIDVTQSLIDTYGATPEVAEIINRALRSSSDEWDVFVKSVEDARTQSEMQIESLKSLTGLFKLIKSDLEAINVLFGEQLAPTLRTLAKAFRIVFGWIIGMPSGLKRTLIMIGLLAGGLLALVAAATALIAPVFLLISSLAIYTMQAAGAAGITVLFGKSVMMLKLVFWHLLPITLALTAAIVVAVGLFVFWSTVIDEINKRFGKVAATLTGLVAVISSALIIWKVIRAVKAFTAALVANKIAALDLKIAHEGLAVAETLSSGAAATGTAVRSGGLLARLGLGGVTLGGLASTLGAIAAVITVAVPVAYGLAKLMIWAKEKIFGGEGGFRGYMLRREFEKAERIREERGITIDVHNNIVKSDRDLADLIRREFERSIG